MRNFFGDAYHDNDVTVSKPFVNPPSFENPLGIRKSTAYDTHDGHDVELQRFSKWGAPLYPEMRGGAMGREPKERKGDKERCRCEV